MRNPMVNNIDYTELNNYNIKLRQKIKSIADSVNIPEMYVIGYLFEHLEIADALHNIKGGVAVKNDPKYFNDRIRGLIEERLPLLSVEKQKAKYRLGGKATIQSIIAEIRCKFLYCDLISQLFELIDNALESKIIDDNESDHYIAIIVALDSIATYIEPDTMPVELRANLAMQMHCEYPYICEICKYYINDARISYTELTNITKRLINDLNDKIGDDEE